MNGHLPRILLGLLLLPAVVDALWLSAIHFAVDWPTYWLYLGFASALAGGGLFYATRRKDERLAAMLFGTAFLIAFSCLASLTNYLLLTVAGPRMDSVFMHMDIAMGIDWPAMIAWSGNHPAINLVLFFAYGSVLTQIALVIPLLGWQSSIAKIYSFCFAVALATILAVGFWTIFPSLGPFSIYELPPSLISRMTLAVGPSYEHEIAKLLANGPGFITPGQIKGLIAFPSFHAVLAVFVAWYAFGVKYVRWPVLALNLVVLVSIPIQGSHYVVDVAGGLTVAAISILLAEKLTAVATRRRIGALPAALSGANTAA